MTDDARWQGKVDQTLRDHQRRLDGINGSIAELAAAVASLNQSLASIKTSMRIIAVVSTIVLTATVSIVVAAFTQ